MDDIERLLADEGIRQTKAEYELAVLAGDWDRYARVFTEDCRSSRVTQPPGNGAPLAARCRCRCSSNSRNAALLGRVTDVPRSWRHSTPSPPLLSFTRSSIRR